jgi:hypothetical protein
MRRPSQCPAIQAARDESDGGHASTPPFLLFSCNLQTIRNLEDAMMLQTPLSSHGPGEKIFEVPLPDP